MTIPPPQLQQQQQPVKRQRPSISPWLMGAAALGGGYLADRYGNGGKGMDWLKSKFQPQTATATASPATPKPVVPDAAAGLQQSSQAFDQGYSTVKQQLEPIPSPGQHAVNALNTTTGYTMLGSGAGSLAAKGMESGGMSLANAAAKGTALDRLGSTMAVKGGQLGQTVAKASPWVSRVATPVAVAADAYTTANSPGYENHKSLGAVAGATKGLAQTLPFVYGSPGLGTVAMGTQAIIDARLAQRNAEVAAEAANHNMSDVQMQLMKRYLTALRDPSTASAARESAQRYFTPTTQAYLENPVNQEQYGHNAWLWDKIKPLLSNNAQ